MKKTLIAILAAMLILTSCAKNKNNIDDIRGSVVQIEDNTGTEDAGYDDDAELPAGIKTGSITDGSYINETFGIRFDITDGWTARNSEEIAAIQDYTGELIDSYDELLEQGQVVVDFMAEAPDGSQNVNVSIGKDAVASWWFEQYGEKEYLENTVKALPDINGLEMEGTVETAEMLGETHYVMIYDVEMLGEMMTDAIAFIVKDDYLVSITAVADSKEEALEALSRFQKV